MVSKSGSSGSVSGSTWRFDPFGKILRSDRDVCYSFLEEGMWLYRTQDREGKEKACQRMSKKSSNLPLSKSFYPTMVSDRFQFEALLLKAQLNALELPWRRT